MISILYHGIPSRITLIYSENKLIAAYTCTIIPKHWEKDEKQESLTNYLPW